ncbi:MAG: glycoside hydrolase family 2 TIM barrel-domain containing protein [Victivallaceae bacterium]|nr:glycoside hydrolase family 2 TIM barrel-domain containing protein [Victivallaceae bacterium]
MKNDLFASGAFSAGCNYWASHAGIFMWSDWRPGEIEQDLVQMQEAGFKIIRVFPLWPDFQPLTSIKGCLGKHREFRNGETPLENSAGVSDEMMSRFKFLADEAERHDIKLIVGLLTGWMSGRNFVPAALERLNVITDAVAVMWEVRFVKYFVRYFKDHPAIAAWDLGNECNCMGKASTREEAWCWASAITNAIKSEDKSRPVVSGMHSLGVSEEQCWNIFDQSEILDVLTTHPYPFFTPNCDNGPLNTIRNCLHPAVESRYYGDVGGKPCVVEEAGTLTSMICNEEVKADYIRAAVFSSWVADCRLFLWWCAYDQGHIRRPPYEWYSHERELGVFRKDRSPKPFFRIFREFSALMKKIPSLPPRSIEAVCILTMGQRQWDAALGTVVLAKQAGFEVEFQYATEPLKASKFYIMPSTCGSDPIYVEGWLELIDKVKSGATLFVSCDSGRFSPFEPVFGLEPVYREKRTGPVTFKLKGDNDNSVFSTPATYRMKIDCKGAEVLAAEPDGNPALTSFALGKGRVYFLAAPIESNTAASYGDFRDGFYKIYKHIASPFLQDRAFEKETPVLGITEHALNGRERIAVIINYSPELIEEELKLKNGWSINSVLYGTMRSENKIILGKNDVLVIKLTK